MNWDTFYAHRNIWKKSLSMQDENKCLSVPDSKVLRNTKLGFVFICRRGSYSLHKTSQSESVRQQSWHAVRCHIQKKAIINSEEAVKS